MGVLCEEFLKKGIPVVIVDRHGEYSSLKVASEELIEEISERLDIVEIISQYIPLKKGGKNYNPHHDEQHRDHFNCHLQNFQWIGPWSDIPRLD